MPNEQETVEAAISLAQRLDRSLQARKVCAFQVRNRNVDLVHWACLRNQYRHRER